MPESARYTEDQIVLLSVFHLCGSVAGIPISFVIRQPAFVIHNSPMLDIRLIREQPDFVKSRLATRGSGVADAVDEVLKVDVARRKAETAVQQLNGERKRLSKEIGGRRARGEEAV